MGLIQRLFAKQPQGAAPPVAGASPQKTTPTGSDDAVHPSKAFPHVMSKLQGIDNPRVLDLGPACPDNMTFFGDLNCRLEIFDLFTWICDYRTRSARRGDSAIDAALDRLLGDQSAAGAKSTERTVAGTDDDETVDLILAWDLIDYLELDEIARLFQRLEPRRGRETRLLMVPSYRGPIPHRPRRYRVVDAERLRCDAPRSDGRPSPGHKERRLLAALQGYEIESSFLMQRGVQEFVFRSAGPRQKTLDELEAAPA